MNSLKRKVEEGIESLYSSCISADGESDSFLSWCVSTGQLGAAMAVVRGDEKEGLNFSELYEAYSRETEMPSCSICDAAASLSELAILAGLSADRIISEAKHAGKVRGKTSEAEG